MFTMDPYPSFKCRFMLKYLTLIAFVITVFGFIYIISKDDITKRSKSTFKHPSVHIWHPKAGGKLAKMLRLREMLGASAYRPIMPGVPSGRKFYFENDHPMVRYLLKRWPHYVTLNQAPKPTIVLPLSSRRYQEGLDTIESVQRFLPKETLILYDIGLTFKQKATLKRLCNVKVIDFPFRQFPPYVRLLMKFHWKPILLQIALNEYGSVLWLESSTRLTTGDLSKPIREAKETGIKIFGIRHAYSTYSVTHPGMLKYLPTNLRRLKVSGQTQTAPMIIYHTREIEKKFMKWLVLCGLERFCLAPLLAKRRCNGLRTNRASIHARYLNCHRFDQSAINILLKNMFNYDTSKFISKTRFSVLKRGDAKHAKNLKFCIGPGKGDREVHDRLLAVKAHLAHGMKEHMAKQKQRNKVIPKVQGHIRGQGLKTKNSREKVRKDASVKGFLRNKAKKIVKKGETKTRQRRDTVKVGKGGSGAKKTASKFRIPKVSKLSYRAKMEARIRAVRKRRRRRGYMKFRAEQIKNLKALKAKAALARKQLHQEELQRKQRQRQQQQQQQQHQQQQQDQRQQQQQIHPPQQQQQQQHQRQQQQQQQQQIHPPQQQQQHDQVQQADDSD